ncbi:unnamed protein product [Mesocestoides corti]|uniref:Chloride channel CLIC-like protein 1 n=1 Tax=Mesocestoides corti TaxID=53468 RepID=A0A0R3U6E7_MESCO|nr:unnamed protein product [Mesocestoides corti]
MSITVNYLSISTHKCLNMVNSLVKLTLAGVAVGFLGYCIYFDRKRRSDPEFRFKLAKRRKERALAAERSSMPVLPPLNDRRAVQKFFFDQIQLGEAALSTGSIDEGVQHFAFAIVCSQSPQLLQVLQQSLSPAIFSKLVAALPGVQKPLVLHSILLVCLCALCGAVSRNPFQMLPDPGDVSVDVLQPATQPSVCHTHTILSRSLWHQLQAALPENFEALPSVDVTLRCKLRKEDIQLIKRFVERNHEFPIPSEDTVNEIFSRFLEPHVQPEEGVSFLYTYALYAVPVLALFIYLKFGCIFLTSVIILSVSAYELYIAAIAKRHALISRLPSVPEHCLPYSKQSLMTKFLSRISFRNEEHDCNRYFQLLMTSPFSELRPDRVILSVISDFVESVFSTVGRSIGLFYSNLNSFVPVFIALPLSLAFLYFTCSSLSFRPKAKRRRALNKNKQPPSLTN